MAFIRIQNAKIDDDGIIVGGSASIVESVYVPNSGKNHCRQVTRESLGTIVYMADRQSGIFNSKTRGLVFYDAEDDRFDSVERDDPRIAHSGKSFESRVRTFFGDSDVVLHIMESSGILRILRNLAVSNDALFSKMVCHTLHGVLRDGSRIGCDRFIERSFVSNISSIEASVLRTDTRYYEFMGTFEVRLEFFRRFVQEMKLKDPGFGKGCYVDSTPLPNSISDLPTNRNCSHGLDSTGIQTRLVLVLDIKTGLPVWFDLIPGNVLDLSTIMGVTDKVSRLIDVRIEDMVLDAGYVCKDVITAYNLDNNRDKTLIARMPAKNGYGFDKLFEDTRNLFSNAKYGFVRQDHSYFGIQRKVTLFGKEEYAYVYVDDENASAYYKDYLFKHGDDYERMSMKDKNRVRYRGGFFVLVSNIDTSPDRMLDRYFGRTEIESVLNCGKEYIGMLPLNKHSEATVNGKLMQDVMTLIVFLMIRKTTIPSGRSVSDYIYDLQSLDCYRADSDAIIVSTPNRQAKEAYALFGLRIPDRISLKEYSKQMFFSM
jgi:hypothetical protein